MRNSKRHVLMSLLFKLMASGCRGLIGQFAQQPVEMGPRCACGTVTLVNMEALIVQDPPVNHNSVTHTLVQVIYSFMFCQLLHLSGDYVHIILSYRKD